jgi:YD repeat-containing protein
MLSRSETSLLTFRSDPSPPGTLWVQSDKIDELTASSRTLTEPWSYTYDADGTRVFRTRNNVTTISLGR